MSTNRVMIRKSFIKPNQHQSDSKAWDSLLPLVGDLAKDIIRAHHEHWDGNGWIV